MLHERSQICTGKGADRRSDRAAEFVAGHVMYKAEAAVASRAADSLSSLLPPACLGGRGIAKIRHRDFSLSLSSGSLAEGGREGGY